LGQYIVHRDRICNFQIAGKADLKVSVIFPDERFGLLFALPFVGIPKCTNIHPGGNPLHLSAMVAGVELPALLQLIQEILVNLSCLLFSIADCMEIQYLSPVNALYCFKRLPNEKTNTALFALPGG
jgi:hypothetical protein